MMKALLSKPYLSSSQNFLILMTLLIPLVGFISMDIYFPSFPAISEAFKIPPNITQLTLTFFLFGFGASQLFYGPLSDYFGRRPVLLIGSSIYLMGSILLTTTTETQILFLARLIQGIGAGAGASLGRVLLRDLFVGNKMAKVASYLTVGIALATALAPAVGGYIQEVMGFRGNFGVMLFFGLFVAAVIILFLPETNQTLSQQTLHPRYIIKDYLQILRNKIFICNMLCSGLALSALVAYAIINPFILQDHFHISPAHYGVMTLLIALGELLGTLLNSQCVSRYGYRAMMCVGISIMLVAASLLLILSACQMTNPWSIVIPSFIMTISIGIIIPNATAGAFSTLTHSIGTAGAVYGFFQILITVFVTGCIAHFTEQTQAELGIVFLTLSLTSLFLFVIQPRAQQAA